MSKIQLWVFIKILTHCEDAPDLKEHKTFDRGLPVFSKKNLGKNFKAETPNYFLDSSWDFTTDQINRVSKSLTELSRSGALLANQMTPNMAPKYEMSTWFNSHVLRPEPGSKKLPLGFGLFFSTDIRQCK